jgi:hypothetical protein
MPRWRRPIAYAVSFARSLLATTKFHADTLLISAVWLLLVADGTAVAEGCGNVFSMAATSASDSPNKAASDRFANSGSEGIGATAPLQGVDLAGRNEFCQRGRIAVDDDRSDLCDLGRGSEEHFGRTFCRADTDPFAIQVGERFDCALAQRGNLERGLLHREQRAQVLLLVAGSPTGSADRIMKTVPIVVADASTADRFSLEGASLRW